MVCSTPSLSGDDTMAIPTTPLFATPAEASGPLPAAPLFDAVPKPIADALQALARSAGGPLVALDTSTPVTSLAGVDPEHGVVEMAWDAQSRPCIVLVDGLRHMLAAWHKPVASIRAVVVGLGPGSFTGLRVGLATAKGLSLGARLPLYGASSLAMAAAQAGPALVLALQDARRGELFAGLYDVDAQGLAKPLIDDTAIMPDALVARVDRLLADMQQNPSALRIVGHDAPIYAQRFGAASTACVARALCGLVAASQAISQKQAIDPVVLIPRYLRLSEPERAHQVRQATPGQS